MNKTVFSGTCTAMVTPFTKDGIDYDTFKKQIEYQISNGVTALCFLGTTGESCTVTDSEYEYISKFVYDTVCGKAKIILGAGNNCTKKAIEKSVLAEKNGADGILAVTPYYNKCTQKGLIKYYNDICDAVSIPVICYNVPTRTGVNILPETMAAIAQHKNSGGIKEACANMEQICETARLIRGKTALYSGDDSLNLSMLAIGAEGVISVLSNVLPMEVNELQYLYKKGKTTEANALHEKLLPVISALFCEVNPIPVKKAMQLIGLGNGVLRPPLTEAEKETEIKLKKALKNFVKIKA